MNFFRQKIYTRTAFAVLAALLVLVLLVTALGFHLIFLKPDSKPDVFIGVDIGYGDATAVYNVANAVSGYANLIIIGSTNVTANTTELTRVCDFLYQKDFYFIVYVGFGKETIFPPLGPTSSFFQMANSRWGAKFLGAYMFDEAGGKQIDLPPNDIHKPVPSASNYSDAAIHYTINIGSYLSLYKEVYYSVPQMKLFTSDYALYWYDYLAGYDVVFTELLGKQNDQLSISLDRGAAKSQGKEWGAILTFGPSNEDSLHVPAFENVTQFYDQMILAWQNDAKYIVVFDSPAENHQMTTEYGILTTQHLTAMKNFWNYAHEHKQPKLDLVQTAYVLPKDYGYGFRNPNDSIWGLWPSDNLSLKIWNEANNMLTTYCFKFDIVFETRTGSIPANLPYKTLLFWNNTTTG